MSRADSWASMNDQRVEAVQQKEQAMNQSTVKMQNKRGQWVPAIPMPWMGFRKKCDCGAKFWTLDGYRGHYALKHILDPEAPDG